MNATCATGVCQEPIPTPYPLPLPLPLTLTSTLTLTRRNQASLELEALDDQEPLVEGGEAKLDGMTMGMTPIHASRER